VPISPVFETKSKQHLFFWLSAGRLAWLFSHESQPEGLKSTQKRARRIISDILARSVTDVMVVSHGLFMFFLRRELQARGFKDTRFVLPDSGRAYLFEK